MAYLRRVTRSPFWQLRARDLDTGKWTEKSTGLRYDDSSETRKAQRAADKASAQEKQLGSGARRSTAFQTWVPAYLAAHWQNEGSRRRYITAWQAIRLFLSSRDIIHPRQVRYDHARDYLQWRVCTPIHGRAVGHNTALLEAKFFSQLMNEAVRHQFTESNPLLRLGIARRAQKIKPAFSDEQILQLKERFAGEIEWMLICSEISLYTGCRFSETAIPVESIDLESDLLRLRDSKRNANDARKSFLVPIDPHLRPTLERLIAGSARETCQITRDKNGRINRVIKDTVGAAYSFHCYRVTFVTRCHRAGLSESKAMRLVNHSSRLVHQIYSRLSVEDIREARALVQLP